VAQSGERVGQAQQDGAKFPRLPAARLDIHAAPEDFVEGAPQQVVESVGSKEHKTSPGAFLA
jgi:hypothetical protein